MKRYTYYGPHNHWYDNDGKQPDRAEALVLLEPQERVYPWWWGFVEMAVIAAALWFGVFIGMWSCHK